MQLFLAFTRFNEVSWEEETKLHYLLSKKAY